MVFLQNKEGECNGENNRNNRSGRNGFGAGMLSSAYGGIIFTNSLMDNPGTQVYNWSNLAVTKTYDIDWDKSWCQALILIRSASVLPDR